MSAATVYVCRGRIEFPTTPLGAAAFDGETDKVLAAISAGIDWEIEQNYPLEASIYSGNTAIVQALLAAGAPVHESTYRAFFHYGTPDMLALLPPRPDIIRSLEQEQQWRNFNHAIINEDIEKVRELCVPERINGTTDLLITEKEMTPLHYAARAGNLMILKYLVQQGAEVNAVNAARKTALRLVAECPSITDKERAIAYRFLESKGAVLRPEITSFWQKFWLRRGTWLSP